MVFVVSKLSCYWCTLEIHKQITADCVMWYRSLFRRRHKAECEKKAAEGLCIWDGIVFGRGETCCWCYCGYTDNISGLGYDRSASQCATLLCLFLCFLSLNLNLKSWTWDAVLIFLDLFGNNVIPFLSVETCFAVAKSVLFYQSCVLVQFICGWHFHLLYHGTS